MEAATNFEFDRFQGIETEIPESSAFNLLIPEMATPNLFFGVDCIDVNAVRGLQFFWCAGYVGGHWPTFHPLCLAYPKLQAAGRVLSYAVTEFENAELCDCEGGDLEVSQVSGWINRQLARGVLKPGAYASWDTWTNGGLLDALAHYGNGIRRIVAHYTYIPAISHIGFDCQQFTDHYANRNVDGNVALAKMFPGAQPSHENLLHYEKFGTGPYPSHRWGKLNERQIVEEYDGARKHPDKYRTYIPLLQARLHWLADRIAFEAIHHHPLPNHKANWGANHYGWRRRQIMLRVGGAQIAK